jgi:hypothetical protein
LKAKLAELEVVLEVGPLVIEVLGGVVSADAPRAVTPMEAISRTAATQMKNVMRERAAR